MFVWLVIVFIFGLLVGSFLNNVIFRLRAKEAFVQGRSRCPHCRSSLHWYDLVPVFSYVWLRGRCRQCQVVIDKQYPLIEIATGLLFVVVVWVELHFCLGSVPLFSACSTIDYLTVIRDWVVVGFLLIIFTYDLRWQMILDRVTLPAMLVVLLLNLYLIILTSSSDLTSQTLGGPLARLFLAAVAGGGFFLLQFLVSRGKWIGGGDIRLGVLMGLILGWPQVVWALILAYLIGAIFALGLILLGRKSWSSHIPFGTFLSLAVLVILFWGDQLVNWYLGIFI